MGASKRWGFEMTKALAGLFGGGSGKKDAAIAAEKQYGANKQNVLDQASNAAKYGNVSDQFGGSRSFRQNPDGSYTTTSTLGQTGQDYLNGMSALGAQARGAMGQGFDTLDPTAIQAQADKYYASNSANLTRTLEAKRQALDVKLRNQGLVPGTEAYDRAARGYENSADDATTALYGQAMGQSYQQAANDLANARNYALNANAQAGGVLNRTLGIDGSGQPNIQTPGAVPEGALYMQGAQQDQAAKNALWGALGGIGGAVLGMPGVGAGIGNGLARMGRGVADAWTAANS